MAPVLNASTTTVRSRGYRRRCLWAICLVPAISLTNGLVPAAVNRQPQRSVLVPRSGLALSMSSRREDPSYAEDSSTTRNGGDEPDINQLISTKTELEESDFTPPSISSWWNELTKQMVGGKGSNNAFRLPPIQIDDPSLLFYDIFLLINLVTSISFWVVHRMQVEYIALAFNEGCLLSILWVCAGLYHGAFLYSAVDGHARPNAEEVDNNDMPWWEILNTNKGGPPAAGLLALNTFINTISLRLIVALVVAVAEHRPVFDDPLEQLIPLEVGTGLVLMSCWRTIHSAFTPRI